MYWHGSIQLALPEGLVFVNLGPGFMNLAPRVYQSWAEGSRILGGEREKKRERERRRERERDTSYSRPAGQCNRLGHAVEIVALSMGIDDKNIVGQKLLAVILNMELSLNPKP